MSMLLMGAGRGVDADASALAANFSGTPRSGDAPLDVQFSDTSSGTPTDWLWEKNDGSGWVDFEGTPTDQDPLETFAEGTWSIRLTVGNAHGSNTRTRTNYILSGVAPATGFAPMGIGWMGDPVSGL